MGVLPNRLPQVKTMSTSNAQPSFCIRVVAQRAEKRLSHPIMMLRVLSFASGSMIRDPRWKKSGSAAMLGLLFLSV